MSRSLTLAALIAAGAAALPAVASAGTYSVWSCRGPDGTPISTAAWVPYGNIANPLAHSDTCASDGSLDVQMIDPPDYQGGSMAGYAFTPPAGTTIAGYSIQMAGKTSSPIGGTHFEVGLLIGGSPTVDPGNGCIEDQDPCLFGDYLGSWDDPANTFANPAVNSTSLGFAASCTAPSACVVGTDPTPYPAFGRLYRSEVVVDDSADPVVGSVGGTIATAGPVSANRTVIADVGDVGGGVQRVELLVDGAVVDSLAGAGRCAAPYTAAAPCPDAMNARFRLDTRTLADGTHTIVVRAFDAAANSASSAPLSVQVANPVAPSGVVVVPGAPEQATPTPSPPPADRPSTQPAPPPVASDAVVVTLRAPKGRVSLRRGGSPRGKATTAGGAPAAGVRVHFQRRAFGGDEDDWTAAGATTTAIDGSFRFPVVRQSGQIRVQPAQAGVTGDGLIVGFVSRLRARLHSSAHRLRNGDRVTLRGRVRGDGGAWAGRDALIQAIVRGKWRTVDSTEVDDDGRLRWTYRFEHTKRTADYRFRVRLPKTRGLPWKAVTTRPVSVRVKGG